MIHIIFGAPGKGKSCKQVHFAKDLYLTRGRELLRSCMARIDAANAEGYDFSYPDRVPIFSDFPMRFKIGYEKYFSPYFMNGYYLGLPNDTQEVMYVPPGSVIFLSVSEKATAFTRLEKLWKLHCTTLTLNTDRKIEVVFITGKGGTGKTYYAKKLLNSLGYDYCVSSSSNDPFQDYLGQKAIILDDLRDKSFELADLLKILDNNTSSSVKSRFANRVFKGEMIVITSSVPINFWYPEFKYGKFDTLNQLYRRVTCYVEMKADTITVYNGLDDKGKPYGTGQVFRNELADKEREKAPRKDFGTVFGRFCENVDFIAPENMTVTQTKMILTSDVNINDIF